ncbi:type II toxin-antitoxin system Phd/YefM family antitoxin [Candidatus Microgenomates bacterium]|nr:type II toxin-antitoxin system Phd/YefM family antitoxin [Candidatus Microgenomates bacterium]
MARQLIVDEKFASIQEAQAGLTKLLQKASKQNCFYRILRNNKPIGVLLPNTAWASLIEDLEALQSKKYIKNIQKARLAKKRYSSSQVKKILKIK